MLASLILIINMKKIVVVLGMHRSGTSVMTRSLRSMGVDLGNDLMPPVLEENEKGYFEDNSINQINEMILRHFDMTWDSLDVNPIKLLNGNYLFELRQKSIDLLKSKFNDSSVFGLKNPRIPLLLPFWQSIFKQMNLDVYYIIALRNPMSVASSLEKRNKFDPYKSYYLWFLNNVHSINNTRDKRRLVVDYDALMDHPDDQLLRMAKFLNLDINEIKKDQFIHEFMEGKLRHSKFDGNGLVNNSDVPRSVVDAYHFLDRMARDDIKNESAEIAVFFERMALHIDEINSVLRHALQLDKYAFAILEGTKYELLKKNIENEALQRQYVESMQAVHASLSWRITAPLRLLARPLSAAQGLIAVTLNRLTGLIATQQTDRQTHQGSESKHSGLDEDQSLLPAEIAFVICVEANQLEPQAHLLCASIRQFGGRYKEVPIIAVSPRPHLGLSASSQRSLEALGVTYVAEPLNTTGSSYGTINRIVASAWAEQHLQQAYLVLLDTDMLFVTEPKFLRTDVGVRPVDVKGSATSGVKDGLDNYWAQLCGYAGMDINALPLLQTTIDQVMIRASYNGGFLVVRRDLGILQRTKDIFFASFAENLRPQAGTTGNVKASTGYVGNEASQWWGSSQAALSIAICMCMTAGTTFRPISWLTHRTLGPWSRGRHLC